MNQPIPTIPPSGNRDAIAAIFAEIVGFDAVTPWSSLGDQEREAIAAALVPNAAVACRVTPTSVEQLGAIVAAAHQHHCPLLPCGQGSKLKWGGLAQNIHAVVSTQGLNRLIDHAIGDMTVTVEAGMRFTELQQILAQAGQFWPVDPTFPAQATIGGILATADTNSLRQSYSGVRDLLLGLSFVRYDGQVAKAGGRVVKNVAGYDLMKLFTGSYGTLGIITEVTLRAYPLPEASQTVVLTGNSEAIAQAAQTLLTSALTPSAMDLLSAQTMTQLGLGKGLGLLLRFQSVTPSVQQQSDRVLALGQTLGLSGQQYLGQDEIILWQQLQERMSLSVPNSTITCKIGVLPSTAVTILQKLDALNDVLAQVHVRSGLGKFRGDCQTLNSQTLLELRHLCQSQQGFLSVLQAPSFLKQQIDAWGYHGNALALMRRVKQQFDPQNILSPHRFVGGI